MTKYLLAIDQGTTSSRAVIFTSQSQPLAQHQIEFPQFFPNDGWVEHDPEQIWQTTLTCCRQAIEKAKLNANEIVALGISNQRETTVIWDRKTGKAIYPAIVWQDRRTALECDAMKEDVVSAQRITDKTGLILDPYFSASKIRWILQNVDGARAQALRGELAFGTIDSFLLWRLTGGKAHATDITNASRTLLFNIHTLQWDDELLQFFDIPRALLPEVRDNCSDFGVAEKTLFTAEIPITGMAGDQQAATIGQACFQPGMIKSTYGTGCFVVLNTGEQVVQSQQKLLSTVAYRIQGKLAYALEGSIFCAGASVKWLRDNLHLIKTAAETENLAASLPDNGGVYCVPAFTGLGAPYWNPHARGAMFGLTRDSGTAHFARAVLEAVCYQTRDLLQAMLQDFSGELALLRVDGGMTENNWMMQFLADMLNVTIERPQCVETSALGVAYLAGLGAGVYASLDAVAQQWQLNRSFSPAMTDSNREALYAGWKKYVTLVAAQAA